jgi:hypothetical protein
LSEELNTAGAFVMQQRVGDTTATFTLGEAPVKPTSMFAMGAFPSKVYINQYSGVLK